MKPSNRGGIRTFQRFLSRNGLVFSCAESCTGGLLAREMTTPPGSSSVFWGGVVTYADEAKTRLLGVSGGLLRAHGAVSGPVAEAMVRGVSDLSATPIAVSITGIAGPDGGSQEKPVGTVWFGLAAIRGNQGKIVAVRHRFIGSRQEIQRQAARWARILGTFWWDSGMDLDSLRSLADNNGKPFVEAFQPPLVFS